jgi:hypothetical protein
VFIYVLTRPEPYKYDETRAFVVVAPDAKTAREYAANESGNEGTTPWLDRKRTALRRIGTASNVKAGVVVRDYLNG